MNAYKYIFNILHSKKQIIKSMIHLFAIFLIVYFMVNNFFIIYYKYIINIWPLKYAKYDVVINQTSEKDYREQIDPNNIQSEVAISKPMWSGKFICGKKEFYGTQETNNVFGASLNDPLKTTLELILQGCILKKDDALLNQDNAILLADKIAIEIGAKVGDTIQIQLPVNDFNEVTDINKDGFDDNLVYDFKVAVIYKSVEIGNALIYDEMYRQIGKDWIGEEAFNENHFNYKNQLFIQFKDKVSGFKEMETFLPTEQNSYTKYGDDWKQHIDYDEYLKSQATSEKSYLFRDTMLILTEKVSIVDTSVVIYQTIIITVAISLLFINKNYKALKLNNKSFGILSVSGMPTKKIFIYIFTFSLIEQILLLVSAHLCLSFIFLFSSMTEYYYTTNLLVLFNMYIPLLSGVIVSSILSGLFATRIVSKKKMLESLTSQ